MWHVAYAKIHSVRANIGVGWGGGGGGALVPPVYILKKALWETSNVSEFITETFRFPRNI